MDAISSTGENFTKQNFVIFSKMCRTYFHDLSCSQVTVWIYNSERWKMFRRSPEILRFQVYKEVLGAISRFLRPTMKLFDVRFRRTLEFLALQCLWRKFWAHFHDICVQKWSCFLRSSDVFWKFSSCEVHEKVLGALSRFLRPKTKPFAVKFRQILEVFSVKAL